MHMHNYIWTLHVNVYRTSSCGIPLIHFFLPKFIHAYYKHIYKYIFENQLLPTNENVHNKITLIT